MNLKFYYLNTKFRTSFRQKKIRNYPDMRLFLTHPLFCIIVYFFIKRKISVLPLLFMILNKTK